MGWAFLAGWLILTVAASVKTTMGIIQQFPALTTQLGATVVLPAPQLNHVPDSLLLPINASHYCCLLLRSDGFQLPHTLPSLRMT